MNTETKWAFVEGSKDRSEMSRIVRANESDFLIAYVLTDARNAEVRNEDIQRGKLIAAAPELLTALKNLATRITIESARQSGAAITAAQQAIDLISKLEGGAL